MTISEKRAAPVLFEDFEVGKPLGHHTLVYDDLLMQRWQHIFGGGNDGASTSRSEAASVATILMMRAYTEVVRPRPPGNIHARQRIEFATLPQPGEQLTFYFDCIAKEIKRERRYLDVSARAENQNGIPILRGVLTLIWAA